MGKGNGSALNETLSKEATDYLSKVGEKCEGCIYNGIDRDGNKTMNGRRCKIFYYKPEQLMMPVDADASECPYYSMEENEEFETCKQCKKCMFAGTESEAGEMFDAEEYYLPYCAFSLDVGGDYFLSKNFTGKPVPWDKYVARYAGKPFQVVANIKECPYFEEDEDSE